MNEKQDVNTKDALLASAIEVFADKGFDAATVRDICGKAKANVAAVNYHFGGKEALYVAVLEEVFPKGEYTVNVDTTIAPEKRLHGFLRDLAREIYERGDEKITQRWAIFLREMAKPSNNLDMIAKRSIQPRADELRDIIADILGPDTDRLTMEYASSNIWALMLDHLLTQPVLDRLTPKRPPVQTNLDAFVDHAARFSLGGLKALKGDKKG